MCQQLVIDKCSFQKLGPECIKKLVKSHRVILPYILYIECVLSQDGVQFGKPKDSLKLLEKVKTVVKAGAYIGKSWNYIFEEEKKAKAPINSIVDNVSTQEVRNGELNKELNPRKEAEACEKTLQPLKNAITKWATKYYENVEKKNLSGSFREEFKESDLVRRFAKWLQVVDESRNQIIETQFNSIKKDITPEWFTWQMMRVCFAWGIEWACKKCQSGPSYEVDANDVWDVLYVPYLFKSDKLLTSDERLVLPLAKATFPKKLVFVDVRQILQDSMLTAKGEQ